MDADTIKIPSELMPKDGRFGSGPSRVRSEAVAALAKDADGYLGTSHRRPKVRAVVRRLQEGMHELFGLPEDYEILLNNGGATLFWDSLCFGIIRHRSLHLCFGEFSSKFYRAVKEVPHLDEPVLCETPPGTHPVCEAEAGIDTYALTHNETSTGVCMELRQPEGADDDALVVVDATSAAGGMLWEPSEVDIYYFSPQKCFAGDGGLWLGAFSPAAIERIEEIHASDRWIPPTLDMKIALDNSRLNQTYNTPALATIHLTLTQVDWMLEHGGLAWAAGRSAESASIIYGWAEDRSFATPFVKDEAKRSPVVATIDFDDTVVADDIAAILRANGIVDTESYRKLGKNQLRVSLFPAIDPEDIAALCGCIDFVVEQMSSR